MSEELELSGFFNKPIEEMNITRREERPILEEPLPPINDIKEPESVVDPEPTPEPAAEPATEPQPAQVQTPEPAPVQTPVQLDWKEVLKQNGYDDFAIGVLEYYKSTGDLTPYVEAKTVDYSAVSDEEILRRDLRSKYADVSDEDFDLLFDRKVVQQYGLSDAFTEDEQRLGKIELKLAAKEIRERLIEQQKQFKAPERQPEPDNSQAVAEQLNAWKSYVDTDQTTQSLLSGKRITIGEGEQTFNFEIDNADSIMQSTYDTNKFLGMFVKQDGSVDLSRWYKVAAYAQNMAAFEKSVINYGKTLGRKEMFDELKNPPKPQTGVVPGSNTGAGDDALLQAFLNNGVHRG
jgi:hypothetical protein